MVVVVVVLMFRIFSWLCSLCAAFIWRNKKIIINSDPNCRSDVSAKSDYCSPYRPNITE